MWGLIATWRMALEGVEEGAEMLSKRGDAADAIEIAIRNVEDNPYYISVGYGGLPNEDMEVELDAAFMDGTTLDFGAVASVKDYANPISIARRLSKGKVNNFLVGEGAAKYAHRNGFERKNMLTERSKTHYKNKIHDLTVSDYNLSPYAGHDTVGMVALDEDGLMTSATSTSGLFMKKAGRVGDSPVIGSGFYVDSEIGGATATGLGEDLMKGAISYEIVRLMASGLSAQRACEKAVFELDKKLTERRGKAGDLSVIAMDKEGNYGAASNIDGFSFVVATAENPAEVLLVDAMKDGKCKVTKASQEWLDNDIDSHEKEVKEKWFDQEINPFFMKEN